MAIQIIVDGYNLIGARAGLRGNLERQREALLERLQRYHDRRGHPIIVVFDGWRSGWINEIEEKRDGLTVIFSRQGEKADDVIQRLAREFGDASVVVSSDRELQLAVQQTGATVVYASEFERKLRQAGSVEPGPDPSEPPRAEKKGNPRKLSKSERKRRQRLGRL
ncbi:MAG TPA: NYN domain-containing protein [Candidatus Acidoferrales bacterium]|nr:NYN domain-containing protein [Candidatus Acidoferrales bacterium]